MEGESKRAAVEAEVRLWTRESGLEELDVGGLVEVKVDSCVDTRLSGWECGGFGGVGFGLVVLVVVGVVVPEEEAEVVKGGGGGCWGLEDSFRLGGGGGGGGGGRIQVGRGGLVGGVVVVVEEEQEGGEERGDGWVGEGRSRGGRAKEVMNGRRAGFGEEGVGSNLIETGDKRRKTMVSS